MKETQEAEVMDEAAKRETKEVQTNELKAEKASLKAPKKSRTAQCKVTLLDGTQYCCDLEVRRGAGVCDDRRSILCFHLWPGTGNRFLCSCELVCQNLTFKKKKIRKHRRGSLFLLETVVPDPL